MRVLAVHNKYALPGGEDQVFTDECGLLRAHGDEVTEYVRDNEAIKGSKPWMVGLRSVWSGADYSEVRAAIRQSGAEIVAVHNFFPLVSPSVYYAAHAEGVPVVQTLHNYRLMCPAANFLRDGRICEDCLGKAVAWPGIEHACYRGSRLLSAGIVAMSSSHRLAGTWSRGVDRYIALTPFMKGKFIEGGFPAERISVKPNFTQDSGVGDGGGGYFLFVGRLSPEKGVATLLKAWLLAGSDRELRIAGSGPEEVALRTEAMGMRGVRFLGQMSREGVRAEMAGAAALIVPSLWYEGFPLTIVEAFAKGTPVIASDLGAMSSLITPGLSGVLFEPGNAGELARVIREFSAVGMREGARRVYETQYTPEINYGLLMEIYRGAAAEWAGRS